MRCCLSRCPSLRPIDSSLWNPSQTALSPSRRCRTISRAPPRLAVSLRIVSGRRLKTPTDVAAARRILVVSQSFFSTLGADFVLGASWPITGNEQECSPQAVVSGGYWKRLGGGSALGNRMLNLDGRDFQISGVLPLEQTIEGSYSLNQPEVFVPIGCDSQERPTSRGDRSFLLDRQAAAGCDTESSERRSVARGADASERLSQRLYRLRGCAQGTTRGLSLC